MFCFVLRTFSDEEQTLFINVLEEFGLLVEVYNSSEGVEESKEDNNNNNNNNTIYLVPELLPKERPTTKATTTTVNRSQPQIHFIVKLDFLVPGLNMLFVLFCFSCVQFHNF